MDPAAVLALCHGHAAAEADFDVERILRTLVPDPVYEFYPANRSLTGRDRVQTFYRVEYPRFAATVAHFEVLGEWVNERAALQEYVIEVRGEAGAGTTRAVSGPVDDAGRRRTRPAQG